MNRLIAALVLGAAPAASAHAQDAVFPVMHIGKSDSRNEVHYAAVVRPDCRLADEPVRAFWLRRGEPERAPRPLSWIEDKLVYGVRVAEAGAQRAVFTLAADDTRPVELRVFRGALGCRVDARVRLLGQWVAPSHAFVTILDGKRLIPSVAHVELHARPKDGQALCERITALRSAGLPCGDAE